MSQLSRTPLLLQSFPASSHESITPLLLQSVMTGTLTAGRPGRCSRASWHVSMIPSLLQSRLGLVAMSHESITPLLLQSSDGFCARSHESSCPLLLQSLPAISHSSGVLLLLQSVLV